MRINNNMSAVVTNNQLLGTEESLADVMEKLSSGFSINHASDNPSGIAIAGKMQAQIDGLGQASTNGSDGISVLQTAEGALSEVTDMIQRMRELSIQAANGTNSTSERSSIQMEIDSLLEEIDRIAASTEFNTINLLDGSLDNRSYAENCSRISTSDSVAAGTYVLAISRSAVQANITSSATYTDYTDDFFGSEGLSVSGTISINGYEITLAKGSTGEQVYEALRDACELGSAEISSPTEALSIKSKKYGADASLSVIFSSTEFAAALGFSADDITPTEIRSETTNSLSKVISALSYKELNTTTGAYETVKGVFPTDASITINGQTISLSKGDSAADILSKFQTAAAAGNFTVSDSVDDIFEITGVNSISLGDNGAELIADLALNYSTDSVAINRTGTDALAKVQVTDKGFSATATVAVDGNKMTVSDTKGFEISFLADAGYEGDISINVTDIGSLTLQIGANEGQTMDVRIASCTTQYMYIDDIDVTRIDGPEDAMNALGDALNYITNVRAQLGAYENRLDHTTSSLDATEENMTSAISRIEDADIASVMVEYTKYTVLEQAGTSALAQANELPQLALQLLQ